MDLNYLSKVILNLNDDTTLILPFANNLQSTFINSRLSSDDYSGVIYRVYIRWGMLMRKAVPFDVYRYRLKICIIMLRGYYYSFSQFMIWGRKD